MNKYLIQSTCLIHIFVLSAQILMMRADTHAAEKLSIMNANWKAANTFDSEQFDRQCKALLKSLGHGVPFPPKRSALEKIANTLWGEIAESSRPDAKSYLDKISIGVDEIDGYALRKDVFVPQYWQGYRLENLRINFGDAGFFVVPERFDFPIKLTSRNSGAPSGAIIAHIALYNNFDDAKTLIFDKVTEGSAPLECYLLLHKVNNGPGNICLVQVSGDTLSDDCILFVRGNIAVYLVSYYKDFGCMDLACRLDAFLVEQMKKQKAAKPSEETKVDQPCDH